MSNHSTYNGVNGIRLLTAALGLASCLLLSAVPALANNTQTTNTSESYVDLSISKLFVTVPNLCHEVIGSDSTVASACNDLGDRAMAAASGNSAFGDIYFEPSTTPLNTTNSFVPNNVGSTFAGTGYAPLFSQHKYDLFGSGHDFMGPLNRIELLAIQSLQGTNPVPPATGSPADAGIHDLILSVLSEPQGATTTILGSITFNIAEFSNITRIIGVSTGQADTVVNWCTSTLFPPLPGPIPNPFAFLCGSGSFAVEAYITVKYPRYKTPACTSSSTTGGLSTLGNCNARDQWIDQTVVGYIAAWDSLGGDQNIAQNFRSQVGYDPSFTVLNSTTEVSTDFRLEQSVELDFGRSATNDAADGILGNTATFQASRQTLQETMATDSGQGAGIATQFGSLVTQDVEGYFFSCINCDTPYLTGSGFSHAFSPLKQPITFMPYTSTWRSIPTIEHAPL